MGPWPLFCDYTLLTLLTKCSISFTEVGPQTQKLLSVMYFNFAVTESWSHWIMESRNEGRTWQIQYSPLIQSGTIIRMELTLSWQISTALAISLYNLLSPITISWTSDYFRNCNKDRHSRMGIILKALPAMLKFCYRSFTVAYEGASFLSVAIISAWIGLGTGPF